MKNSITYKQIKNFKKLPFDDEDTLLRKSVDFEDINFDEDKREFSCVMSSQKTDLQGDIIISKGINFEEYDGVLLYNHEYSKPALGAITDIKIKDDHIVCDGYIGKAVTFCNDIWALMRQKIVKGISLGARPTQILMRGTQAFTDYVTQNAINITNATKRIVTACSVYEVTICNAGINSDALVLDTALVKSLDGDTIKRLQLDKLIKAQEEAEEEAEQVEQEEVTMSKEDIMIALLKEIKDGLKKEVINEEDDITVVSEPGTEDSSDTLEPTGEQANEESEQDSTNGEQTKQDSTEDTEEGSDSTSTEQQEEAVEVTEENSPDKDNSEEEVKEVKEEEEEEVKEEEINLDEVEFKVIREGEYVLTEEDENTAQMLSKGIVI